MPSDDKEEEPATTEKIVVIKDESPTLEASVWAKLVTDTILPAFEFPKVVIPKFEFPKLPEIDWEATFRKMEGNLRQLAMRGWSLPWHLGIPDVEDLANESPNEIDSFFERYFEDGGLATLRRDILEDMNLLKWKLLLEQCFKNYESGDFQICIPSLIMVLEGSFNYTAFFSEGHRKEFFRQHVDEAVGFQKMMWVSLRTFCDVIFMPGDPRRSTDYPNRHKIMHGLDDPAKWKKVDCLRLFQALDSTRRLK
jgi:hypothetical protein